MSSVILSSSARRHRWCALLGFIAIAAGGTVAHSVGAQTPRPSDTRTIAADPMNLGFERVRPGSTNQPSLWIIYGPGYNASLDAVAPFSGARSLRIRAIDTPAPDGFGVATTYLPDAALPAGKVVRLRGYIRTEGVEHGYAGLWLRADANGETMLDLDNMEGRGARGTTPWTAYEITMRMHPSTMRVAFGVLHPGDGTAWFDSLSIEIDGKQFVGDVSWAQPSDSGIEWVREQAFRRRATSLLPTTSSHPCVLP